MRLILFLLVTLTLACGPRGSAVARPTAAAAPTSTIASPTRTPSPDYRGMRVRLLTPLGAMIVALRGNDRPQAAAHLADFNSAADTVLASIETDVSKPANALHSAVVNVRSHPGNLAALEQDRQNLIVDIP